MRGINNHMASTPKKTRATDDRFISLEFLAFELEDIAEKGGAGDAEAMRLAAAKLREWREKFDSELAELERAIGEFSALDGLLEDAA